MKGMGEMTPKINKVKWFKSPKSTKARYFRYTDHAGPEIPVESAVARRT